MVHWPELGGYTAFVGPQRLSSGELHVLGQEIKRALEAGETAPVLLFHDATGRQVDLDLHGSADEVAARLTPSEPAEGEPRGRGRPKLGVVAREVTLLPRHWDWLNAQPGGASVTLRKLVEAARKAGGAAENERRSREAAYAFLSAMAGDAPGFEDAARALFAGDLRRFAETMESWPADVRDYAVTLAFAARDRGGGDEVCAPPTESL